MTSHVLFQNPLQQPEPVAASVVPGATPPPATFIAQPPPRT